MFDDIKHSGSTHAFVLSNPRTIIPWRTAFEVLATAFLLSFICGGVVHVWLFLACEKQVVSVVSELYEIGASVSFGLSPAAGRGLLPLPVIQRNYMNLWLSSPIPIACIMSTTWVLYALMMWANRRSRTEWAGAWVTSTLIVSLVFMPALVQQIGYKAVMMLSNPIGFFLPLALLLFGRRKNRKKVSPFSDYKNGGCTRNETNVAFAPPASDGKIKNDDQNNADVESVVPAALGGLPTSSAMPTTTTRPDSTAPGRRPTWYGIWFTMCATSWIIAFLHVVMKLPYRVATIEADGDKVFFTLIVWPVVRELSFLTMRKGARSLVFDIVTHGHRAGGQAEESASPRIEIFVMGISVWARLIGRFVTSSMKSPVWTLFVALAQAFQEIMFRQTAERREQATARWIGRLSEDEVVERFRSKHALRFKGRRLLIDMIAE